MQLFWWLGSRVRAASGSSFDSLCAMSKLNIDNLKKGHWDSTVRSWNWWLLRMMDVSAEFWGSYWSMVQYGLYMVNIEPPAMGFQPYFNHIKPNQQWSLYGLYMVQYRQTAPAMGFQHGGLQSELWRSCQGWFSRLRRDEHPQLPTTVDVNWRWWIG